MTHLYTSYAWSGDRSNMCDYIPNRTYNARSPSNIDASTRSKNVNNPKDSYGFRAMSPFNASKHTLTWPTGSSIGIRKNLVGCTGVTAYEMINLTQTGTGPIVNACSDTSTYGMQTEQLMRQRAEANLARADINVLQFAAFLPSTLRTLKQNADTLSTLLTNFRHINWQWELKQGGNARRLFLQYLFVHEQLLRDIRGGIKFLQQESGPKGQLVRGRSFNTSTRTIDSTFLNNSWGDVGLVRYTGNIKVDQRAVAVARITCDTTYVANQLGLTNPLYLGWDLVKYSWIIDQVVDIGGFIGSLSSTHGLEFLGTSVTTHSTNVGQLSVEGIEDSTKSVIPDFSVGSNNRKNVVRRVYDTPFNGVTVRNPFRNNAMISAAALAALSLELRQTRNIYTSVVNTLR